LELKWKHKAYSLVKLSDPAKQGIGERRIRRDQGNAY
jgi:hypothetical protein